MEIHAMARAQHASDERPGAVPDIRTDEQGITFVMAPTGTPRGDELVIRCDVNGEIWVAIWPDRDASE
jgi:hypothetical protein